MLSPTKKVELMMKSGLSVQNIDGKKVFATDGSAASLQRIFMFWSDPKLYTQLDVCSETKQQFIEAAMHAVALMNPDNMQPDFIYLFKKATGLENYTADTFSGFSINIPDLIKISSVKPEPTAIAAEPFVTVPVAENLTATTVASESGLTNAAIDTSICTGTNCAPIRTAVERTEAIIAAHKELTGIQLKSPVDAYKEQYVVNTQKEPEAILSTNVQDENTISMDDIVRQEIADIKSGKHIIRFSHEFLEEAKRECSAVVYSELVQLIEENPNLLIPIQIDERPRPKFQNPNHDDLKGIYGGEPRVKESWDITPKEKETKVAIELSVKGSDITMIYKMMKSLEENGMEVITCKIC